METLLKSLEAEGIPAGPIDDVAQAFADPQVIAVWHFRSHMATNLRYFGANTIRLR